ncbi:jmjC domain-containing protein 8 isoform X3 [Oncorhynchus kisutch]|uniref:jmjC domain-containing protein 8 isoform X3 n=1 Tax=Oncorhynchus kisutch TaxID=8019 RepID=UPI0012DC4B28|nr:jmjC domain-containing protein 8 isoform X3 [Oncorhynchus kisutch]
MEYKLGIQVFLLLFWRSALDAPVSENDGGWSSNSEYSLTDEGPCNIDIWDKASLSHRQFIQQYAYSKPVILKGFSDNTKFQFLCSKSSLLQQYGERMVRLSTANTYSYRKVDVRFEEFVDLLLRPQSLDTLGSDTLYFFGDNNFTEWHSLFENYKAPRYMLPHTTGAYSFGIADLKWIYQVTSIRDHSFHLAREPVCPSIGMDLATLRSSMAGSAGSCTPRTRRPISTPTTPPCPGSKTHTLTCLRRSP